MAKRMKNPSRKKAEEREKHVFKIEEAMDQGASTKKQISEKSGIKIAELNKIFKEEKELYRRFCETRRTIVDLAADNIYDIVEDQTHPKNAEVSKWVLNHYKSDLDATLESKNDEEVEVEIDGTGERGSRPTVIRFRKPKITKEE